MGENSWQRNRDARVVYSEEGETFEHFILMHCTRLEKGQIESRALHRPKMNQTKSFANDFLENTKKEKSTKDVERTQETNQEPPREFRNMKRKVTQKRRKEIMNDTSEKVRKKTKSP